MNQAIIPLSITLIKILHRAAIGENALKIGTKNTHEGPLAGDLFFH